MSWSPLKPFCILYFNDKAKVEKPTFVGVYGPALISRASTERNFLAQTTYSAPMCVRGEVGNWHKMVCQSYLFIKYYFVVIFTQHFGEI